MIPRLVRAGKAKILLGTGALVLLATLADWASGNNISLAALYIVPMMLGAVVLRPAESALLALVCSYLRYGFDVPGSPLDLALRFVFAAFAYFVSALFVTALVRNREQTIKHLNDMQVEQSLRREAQEQLSVLAESSPAGILTIDGSGVVLAANDAASRLFMMPGHKPFKGSRVVDYLPFLADALRLNAQAAGLRTAVKCQGRRDNGEIFLAHMWLSAYVAPEGKRLAAIIVDSSEEMRDREEEGLHQLLTGNQIAAAAIAHEVRNVCGAMTMLCEDLRQRHSLSNDKALGSLDNLVGGLEAIASFELQSKSYAVEEVQLQEVLDNLRIVIEPAWREIEGSVRWHLPPQIPWVCADPYGLLQSFLNLAQNSHRAVQTGVRRELNISVTSQNSKVIVKFEDSGPGVCSPEELFRPFQQGAAGTGLGLYVSRFLVRRYGGELRFEPVATGSCFIIELDSVLRGV